MSAGIRILRKVRRWLYETACVIWALAVCSPAFALWAVSLFSLKVDIRFSYMDPLGELPGWSRNELTYFAPRWRPF